MNAAACIAPAAWLLAIIALLITLGLIAGAVILYLAVKQRATFAAEYASMGAGAGRRTWARMRAGANSNPPPTYAKPPAPPNPPPAPAEVFSFNVFDQRTAHAAERTTPN